MKLKFRTEKDCFHNGRYYDAGSIVECDCKECNDGKVPYFKRVNDKGEEIENVSQETIKDEKKEDVKEEVKEEPKKKAKTKIQITD